MQSNLHSSRDRVGFLSCCHGYHHSSLAFINSSITFDSSFFSFYPSSRCGIILERKSEFGLFTANPGKCMRVLGVDKSSSEIPVFLFHSSARCEGNNEARSQRHRRGQDERTTLPSARRMDYLPQPHGFVERRNRS